MICIIINKHNFGYCHSLVRISTACTYSRLRLMGFCEELWPKENYIHFICLFMGACVQNGTTVSCMDTVLELVVDKELEIWTSLSPSFAKEGLLQLPG